MHRFAIKASLSFGLFGPPVGGTFSVYVIHSFQRAFHSDGNLGVEPVLFFLRRCNPIR